MKVRKGFEMNPVSKGKTTRILEEGARLGNKELGVHERAEGDGKLTARGRVWWWIGIRRTTNVRKVVATGVKLK